MKVNTAAIALQAQQREATLAKEQSQWLLMHQGYAHFMRLSSNELEQLLTQLLSGAKNPACSPALYEVLKATLQHRIKHLRKGS